MIYHSRDRWRRNAKADFFHALTTLTRIKFRFVNRSISVKIDPEKSKPRFHFPGKPNPSREKTEKMHDFCFTIPYGMILIVGGFIGFLKKGSIASLAGGGGAGLLVVLAGFISLKAFEKKKTSSLAVVLETGLLCFASICLFSLLNFDKAMFYNDRWFLVIVLLGNSRSYFCVCLLISMLKKKVDDFRH